ncbi:MAG: IS110 family transposase [Sedimentisphaerales bacterium]|jgi:transposase
MTTVSKKQKWFNAIHLTPADDLYVGIDAHKKSLHVALFLNDAPAIDFVMPPDSEKLIDTLNKLRPALRMVVYEAGPTGYCLARAMQNVNLPVNVVAPSKTPRQSAPDSKTDSLDARKLAEYAAKGLLRHIAIPTRHQEAQRQLTRLREQLVAKQTRVKLQIKGFLLQHGIDQPQGLSRWSATAVEYLKKVRLSEQLQYCLDILLDELSFIIEQRKLTEQRIKEAFSEKPHSTMCKLLTTHPGVGPVIAAQFAAEIFNPRRFTDKTQLAKYVGLAPSVRQSGQMLRDGPILKTGRPQLRCSLIQGAWLWIRKDPNAYNTFCRLIHNTGHKNKAITAMARKLAVHLWKMACDNKPYSCAV